jgi:hypothetical protein
MGLGRFSSLIENDKSFIGVFCGNTDEELIVFKALCEYRGPIFAELYSSGVPFGMTNRAIFNWNPDYAIPSQRSASSSWISGAGDWGSMGKRNGPEGSRLEVRETRLELTRKGARFPRRVSGPKSNNFLIKLSCLGLKGNVRLIG